VSLKNPVTPPEIDPGTVRLVVQRLNHYATPGPLFVMYMLLTINDFALFNGLVFVIVRKEAILV